MVVLKRAFSDLKYLDGGLGLAEFFCSATCYWNRFMA